MDSLAPTLISGERQKTSDLFKQESGNKSLIIPDSDADEEKSKTPLADTNFGALDETLSLRSQLYSLQTDDAISLSISILRSSIAINAINDETIAEQVRIALRYLTKLPDPEPDNNFALDKFVYEYNGLDVLVELIRQPHQTISIDAVRALYRVASVDRYMSLAVDASVPKTVVDILSNSANTTDNRTICDGLLLLGNMAFNAEARAAIGDNNGVKVILLLLKNNRSNVEIADQCCYALANLAVSSHTNSQAMIDGNAIDEIIRIMSMHSRDVQLLESATFVLTNLCTDGEQPRMQIVSAGGGRILGQVLHNHANIPRLMKAVLRTLGNLACSALAVTTLVKDGLIPILMAKVQRETAVRELELVVLVLSNMAIEGDRDTLAQLTSPDGDVVPRLIQMCNHPTILMVVVALIDTLITRYEPFAEQIQTWKMLMPLLIQSLPMLTQTGASIGAGPYEGAGTAPVSAPDAIHLDEGHDRLERLRMESIQHVYHAVGILAATSSTTRDHHINELADLRSYLYKTLDTAAESVSLSGPILDCAIQAIWCLARLTTRISFEEIENDQVVNRLLHLFGVLIGLIDNQNSKPELWAAIGGILRVLAQLATLHRSICSYISRYSMPAITRAFIMFTERKPQPDPETSAAFAGLLSCMTSTTTSLVHLGVDLADAICRLLQTATNEDGTLTVASASSFIVLLSKMAANDRRGNIRAALNPTVLVKVMKALQSGATSQFQGADQTSIQDLVEACQSLQIVLDEPSLRAPSPISNVPLTPVRNIRSIPKKTFLQIVHSPTSAQESVRRASQIVNPATLVASIKIQQQYRRKSSAMFNPRRKTSSDLGDHISERNSSLSTPSLSLSDPSEHSGRSSSLEPSSRIWASILDECGPSADRLRAHSRIQEIVLQNGIPDAYRAQVWRTLSGSDDLRRCYDVDYYMSLVKIVEKHGSPAQTEIRKDIRRTLPFTDLFKTETGIQKLERVLSAYCLRNSETVGYCQSMNNLCGALLTMLSEEDAFWVLSCMIETRVGYYCKSMCALLRDQLVLKDLLSFQQPILYDHLLAHGVNIDTFTVSWFLCLFMEAPVPFTETMMVWDAILLFGDEMIFLFALEIFKRCSTQILELKSESELLVYFLRGLPHDIPSVQTMLASISVGSIASRVSTLREVHEKTVAANCMQIRPSTLLNVEDHHYYDFSEAELAQLWKAFLSPSPWHILLHASIPNSTWFQHALKQIVFDTTSSMWRDHGLVSGLMDRLFVVADTNRTSHIDFEEFLVVAHILLKGTNEMRMQFAFAFADRDEDEMVSKTELYDMVVMLEATYNGWEGAESGARQFVESVFDSADTSVTSLDIDEFCHFALVHPLIASFFKLQAGIIPDKWAR